MKVAWVTGGGTGIGRALAQALYQEGYAVMITGRRPKPLAETVQALSAFQGPGQIMALSGDICENQHIENVLKKIHDAWGPVDLLINNAAINPHHRTQESTLEEFSNVFNVNCLSAISITKKVLPEMLSQRQGSIVNISSMLGRMASLRSAAYSTSKFALAGFTDSLRQELTGTGVHVMTVYPGFILTAMTEPFARSPLKRRLAATPEQMATAILFGLRRRKREITYPWYVSWVLRAHRLFPNTLEAFYRQAQGQ